MPSHRRRGEVARRGTDPRPQPRHARHPRPFPRGVPRVEARHGPLLLRRPAADALVGDEGRGRGEGRRSRRDVLHDRHAPSPRAARRVPGHLAGAVLAAPADPRGTLRRRPGREGDTFGLLRRRREAVDLRVEKRRTRAHAGRGRPLAWIPPGDHAGESAVEPGGDRRGERRLRRIGEQPGVRRSSGRGRVVVPPLRAAHRAPRRDGGPRATSGMRAERGERARSDEGGGGDRPRVAGRSTPRDRRRAGPQPRTHRDDPAAPPAHGGRGERGIGHLPARHARHGRDDLGAASRGPAGRQGRGLPRGGRAHRTPAPPDDRHRRRRAPRRFPPGGIGDPREVRLRRGGGGRGLAARRMLRRVVPFRSGPDGATARPRRVLRRAGRGRAVRLRPARKAGAGGGPEPGPRARHDDPRLQGPRVRRRGAARVGQAVDRCQGHGRVETRRRLLGAEPPESCRQRAPASVP